MVHVSGGVDPIRDIGVIETELMLADLDALDRRKQKTEKKVRAGDKKAAVEVEFLTRLIGLLDKGEWLGNLTYTVEERALLTECQLLSSKPVLFVANVSEHVSADEAMVKAVRELADERGARVVTMKAPQAAGKSHSDMERGFIRAEVYHYDDLLACGSEAKVKEKGLFRLEGKDYVITEADVVYFRFNV